MYSVIVLSPNEAFSRQSKGSRALKSVGKYKNGYLPGSITLYLLLLTFLEHFWGEETRILWVICNNNFTSGVLVLFWVGLVYILS